MNWRPRCGQQAARQREQVSEPAATEATPNGSRIWKVAVCADMRMPIRAVLHRGSWQVRMGPTRGGRELFAQSVVPEAW